MDSVDVTVDEVRTDVRVGEKNEKNWEGKVGVEMSGVDVDVDVIRGET